LARIDRRAFERLLDKIGGIHDRRETRLITTLVERWMGELAERPMEERQPVQDRPEPERPPVREPFSDDDRRDPPPLRT